MGMQAPITSGRLLSRMTTDTLATRVQHRSTVEGGIAYARTRQRPQKSLTRNLVARAFSTLWFPNGLAIVTMPNLAWSFERHLLANREHGKRAIIGLPRRTFICAIESDEAIYRSALKTIPGLEHGLAILPPAPFATSTARTRLITRYHRCKFEDMARVEEHAHDGAWLDFTGTLSPSRIEAVAEFFDRLIRSRLVLTFTVARQKAAVTAMMREHGGLAPWLQKTLPSCRIQSVLTYRDTMPMVQVVIDKTNGKVS